MYLLETVTYSLDWPHTQCVAELRMTFSFWSSDPMSQVLALPINHYLVSAVLGIQPRACA